MKHVDEHLQCHEMKEESGIQNGGRVGVEALGTEGVSDQRLSFFFRREWFGHEKRTSSLGHPSESRGVSHIME